MDAIIVIPETTKESDPILYAGLGRASQYGYAIVASQDTAVSIGMFKTCYDVTYISLSNRGDIDRVVSRFADILDSSMELRIRTIDECDKEYREAYISQYASTICLFFILLIMAAWGYWELVTMRYQNGRRNVAIMRALGMEKHSWNMTFIWHNIRNALVSCAVGAGMVYGMRWLLRYKYEQALNMFNWPETDLWNVDADVIKEVTRLQHVFLFDSEIFVVPVGRALVLIGTFLVVISTIITVLVIHKKKSEEIIDDLAEKSKGTMHMIQIKDLNKTYGEGTNAVHALRNCNVEFEYGKFTAIIGTSGSGKSTLLHLMGGLDTKAEGDIFYDDEDILRYSDAQLAKFRRKI